MFYAIGYMEKATCTDVKYSSFNSAVRFVIFFPGSFVYQMWPSSAYGLLYEVLRCASARSNYVSLTSASLKKQGNIWWREK